jgi:hypothetical protein
MIAPTKVDALPLGTRGSRLERSRTRRRRQSRPSPHHFTTRRRTRRCRRHEESHAQVSCRLHRLPAARRFATVAIDDLKLVIRDVAIHQKDGARWASLPARPQVRDGELVKDPDTGKIAYVAVLEFTDLAVRDAFSMAVIRAVLEREPTAFDVLEAVVS